MVLYVMDRDGWSGKFHLCSKEAIAISDLTLIVYNNITKIKYNTIEERRNGTKGGSGRVTTPGRLPIWAFSRPIYIRPNHVTVYSDMIM